MFCILLVRFLNLLENHLFVPDPVRATRYNIYKQYEMEVSDNCLPEFILLIGLNDKNYYYKRKSPGKLKKIF